MKNQRQELDAPQGTKPRLDPRFLLEAIAIQAGLPRQLIESDGYADLIEQTVDHIRQNLFGQEVPLAKLARAFKAKVAERFVGWKQACQTLTATWDQRPVACFLGVGSTGVGKTETAKLLAQLLFNGRLIALKGSEVGPEAEHGTSMWTGSPPGYVGSDRGGILTNGLRQYRSGVILVDELEKADRGAIQNLLLPLMGDGVVTDHNNGETLYATDFVVFCTSNLRIEANLLRAIGFRSEDVADEEREDAVFEALSQHLLPEMLGRLSAVLCYQELDLETQWKVWSQLRHELESKIGPRTKFILDEAARRYIQDRFSEIQTGARGIKELFLDQLVPLSVGVSSGNQMQVGVTNRKLRLAI